jgi:hypothetical protein
MDLTWLQIAGLLSVGVFAGCVGALTGIGAGLMVTPVLTLFFGVPIRYAIATSLCCVIATSSGAAARYVEQRLTDVRLGMTLELSTTVGAVSGAVIAGLISREVLAILFVFILIYGGASTLRESFKPQKAEPDDPNSYQVKHLPLGLAGSGGAGVISGLLGVGGGIIKVPLMYLAMGVPFKIATATSNFMNGITAAASAFIFYARGDMLPLIAAPTAIGVFLGASVGTHLFRRAPSRRLVILFSLITFCFAAMMLWKALHGGYGH